MQFPSTNRRKLVLFLMFSFSKTLVFLLLIKIKNSHSAAVEIEADKIVSGHPVNAGELPFMVLKIIIQQASFFQIYLNLRHQFSFSTRTLVVAQF
jgi:hypothetical protein